EANKPRNQVWQRIGNLRPRVGGKELERGFQDFQGCALRRDARWDLSLPMRLTIEFGQRRGGTCSNKRVPRPLAILAGRFQQEGTWPVIGESTVDTDRCQRVRENFGRDGNDFVVCGRKVAKCLSSWKHGTNITHWGLSEDEQDLRCRSREVGDR